jgi:hypothetical protein
MAHVRHWTSGIFAQPLRTPGSQGGDGHGLDHGKRIGFHEDAVLKRPRF